MSMQTSLQLNSRINHNGYKGTIRYIGGVEGTTGSWLGVEWDDRTRGKHSGVKDGKSYFQCRVPGSGSFIRPNQSVVTGRSFLQALQSKYVETPQKDSLKETKETVTLGSSSGVIEVEAVGLDRIRTKLSNLEKLREVSLDGEDIVLSNSPELIGNICPNIRGLNLSNNLLISWATVAEISSALPNLASLDLSRNHLTDLTQAINTTLCLSFRSLQELRLNDTLVSWNEIRLLLSGLPHLKDLEAGYNEYTQLTVASPDVTSLSENAPTDGRLEILNLDSNALTDWIDIANALSSFPRLARVILTCNSIDKINFPPNLNCREGTSDRRDNTAPGKVHARLSSVRHLGLHSNRISRWDDIDALWKWTPGLESLSLGGNPLAEGHGDYRPLVIARIPSLLVLDGGNISNKERNDSELYYLSHAARDDTVSNADRSNKYPQWRTLCKKHGVGEVTEVTSTSASRLIRNSGESNIDDMNLSKGAISAGRDRRSGEGRDTLSSRLISINVYLCARISDDGHMLANLTSNDRNMTPSAPEVAPSCPITHTTPSARASESSMGENGDKALLAARSVARALHSAMCDSNPEGAPPGAADNTQIQAPYSHKFQIQVLPSMTLRAFSLKLRKTATSLGGGGRSQLQSHQAEQTRSGPFTSGKASSATPNELLTKPTHKTDHGSEVSSSPSSHQSSSLTTASTTRLNQDPSPNRSSLGRAPPSTVTDYTTGSPTSDSTRSGVRDQLHQRQPRLPSQSRLRSQAQLQPQLRAWLVMGPRSSDVVSELSYNGMNDTRDLAWLGVEDGSDVVVWLEG